MKEKQEAIALCDAQKMAYLFSEFLAETQLSLTR